MEPGDTVFIDRKKFTYAEFCVIKEAMKGKSHKEIGSALGKRPRTVDTQMLGIFKKLDIHKVTELIAWGIVMGFDREGNYKPKAMEMPTVDRSVRVRRKKRKKIKSSGKKLLK